MEETAPRAFVGTERQELVDELVGLVGKTQQTGDATVVSLESPTGWGKTTVIQRVFAALAATQPAPGYWPRSLVEHATTAEQRRNRIYPPGIAPPAGARMSWMWWGITCHRRPDGTFAQALADDITQLYAHQSALIASSAESEQMRRSLRQLFVATLALYGSLASAPFGTVKDTAEAGIEFGRTLSHAVRSRAALAPTVGTVDAQDAARYDLVGHAADIVRLSRSHDRPLIIVIEDAHDADRSLVRFLDELLNGSDKLPVVVLCAGRSDWMAQRLMDPMSLATWIARFEEANAERVVRRPLSRLADSDLATLVREHAPSTSTEVVDALVARADGNPLVLAGLLELPALDVVDGAVGLTATDIAELPTKYDDILALRWRSLNGPVQDILCRSALLGRETHDALLEAVGGALPTHYDAAEALARAIDPEAWLRRRETVVRFHEDYAYRVARDRVPGHLPPSDVATVQRAAAGYVSDQVRSGAIEDRSAAEARALLRSHVQVAGDGPSELGPSAAASASRLAADAYARGDYAEAVALARRVPALRPVTVDPDPIGAADEALDAARLAGQALGELGDYRAAHTEISTALHRLSATVPESSVMLAMAQHDLAIAELELGLYEDARTRLEAVLEDGSIELPMGARASFMHGLASALGSLGWHDEALSLQRAVLAIRERSAAGEVSREVLLAQGNLAVTLRYLGEREEALELERAVATGYSELLGDDHRATLTARGNLGLSLAANGLVDEGLETLRDVEARRAEVLGVDHPATHVARMNLATTCVSVGRPKDAVPLLEPAVEGLARRVGTDHVHFAAALTALAAAHGALGDVQRARQEFDQALAALAHYPPSQPEVLIARANIASQLSRHGSPGDAVARFEEISRDAEAAFGIGSVQHEQARDGLADALIAAGRASEALGWLEDRSRDRQATLGPLHAETLHADGQLGLALINVGQLREGLALLEDVVGRAERSPGMPSRDTLATRVNIATTLRVLGDFEGAMRAHREAADAFRSEHGPYHPDAIEALINLGMAQTAAGRLDDALQTLEEARANARAVFPADHQTSLHADSGLHAVLAKLGRHEEAYELISHVADAYEHLFGPDDMRTLRSRRHLAEIIYATREFSRAAHIERDVLARMERTHGARHVETANTQRNLALSLAELGQWKQARDLLSRALRTLVLRLGDDHPDVHEARRDLKMLRGR